MLTVYSKCDIIDASFIYRNGMYTCRVTVSALPKRDVYLDLCYRTNATRGDVICHGT